MPKFRVTYVESFRREVVVEAPNATLAEDAVAEQMQNAEHHHAVEAWADDLQAKPYRRPPLAGNRHCIECCARRE